MHDRLRALLAQHLEQGTALLLPRLRQRDSKLTQLSSVFLAQDEYPPCQPPQYPAGWAFLAAKA